MKTIKTIGLLAAGLTIILSFSLIHQIKDPMIEKNIKKWDSILIGKNVKTELSDSIINVLKKPDSVQFNIVKTIEKYD